MKNLIELGFSKTENELQLSNLPVKGSLPEWLQGSFIRNGPGTFYAGDQQYRHWFDGLAMLHNFSFSSGRVDYMNKFLHTEAYKGVVETGKITHSEYATDPCRSLFGKVTAVFDQRITDSAKVNVGKIHDKYLAFGETSMQIEFDPKTLESMGVYKYEQKYKQHITNAHPHFDFKENAAYQHVIRFGRVSHYRMLRIKANGQREVIGEIPVSHPAYLHSFGMSQKYLIIAEFPLTVYPLKLLFQLKPFIENYKWKPEKGTTFYVMDRQSGELAGKYKTDAFFAFHHINAFEQGNELVLDLDAYDDAEIINSFYLNRLEDETMIMPAGHLKRFRIDLTKKDSVTSGLLSDEIIEMPRFDYEKYNMNGSYQFVYGLSLNKDQRRGFFNQLVKIDIKSGKSKIWGEANCHPSEPVFTARPGGKSEDDGVVLTIVLDKEKGNSFLLVLDAASFTEIARAEVEQPILMGFHGEFFR